MTPVKSTFSTPELPKASSPSAVPGGTTSVPASTVVRPEYCGTAVSVSVPAPFFVKPPTLDEASEFVHVWFSPFVSYVIGAVEFLISADGSGETVSSPLA